MEDIFVEFENSNIAHDATEAINKAASGLPATRGIFGFGPSVRLRGDELSKESTDSLNTIRSIIHLYGGKLN